MKNRYGCLIFLLFSAVLLLFVSLIISVSTKNEIVAPTPDIIEKRDLPETYRNEYMKACSENGDYTYCLCTVNYLDDNYSNKRVIDMSVQFVNDGKITEEMTSAMEACIHLMK